MNIETVPANNLDARIAAGFRAEVTSAELQVLIKDVERGLEEASELAQRERIRALDPELPPSGLPDARQRMQDAEFRKDRLEAAKPKLEAHLAAVMRTEENDRRKVVYEEVERERDSLASELKALYPPADKQIAELLARIVANDRRIEWINTRALPSGCKRLLSAELVARGLEGFRLNRQAAITAIPRITGDTRLPAFEFDQFEPYSWPPRLGRGM